MSANVNTNIHSSPDKLSLVDAELIDYLFDLYLCMRILQLVLLLYMNISLPAVPISLSRYSGRGSWLGDRECGRKGIFNGRKKIRRKRDVHILEKAHWTVCVKRRRMLKQDDM